MKAYDCLALNCTAVTFHVRDGVTNDVKIHTMHNTSYTSYIIGVTSKKPA